MSLNWEGEVAVIKVKLEHYETEIKELEVEIQKLKTQNERIVSMANKWKGGGAVLIALGSATGAFLSYYEQIKSIIAKLLN